MASDHKTCFKCGETLHKRFFYQHKGMKDGLLNKCKICTRKDVDVWRKKNPDCRKKEHARVREKKGFLTKEEFYEKRRKNAIGRKASSLKYAHKRRIQELQRVYSDFDEFVFEEAVSLTKQRECCTGIKWHVDHIVPINHRSVCGLHVANNFQVVPALWNVKKGNRNMNLFITAGF